MDTQTDEKPTIPPEVLREEREERKGGAFALLLSKLGLGGGASGAGAAAGGAAGGSAAGLGAGLLASKAGLVGLILAGTTVAAGIGLMSGGGGGESLLSERGLMGLLPRKDPAGERSASGQAGGTGAAASSLEYFASANVKSGVAGSGVEAVEPSASAAAAKTADSIGATPDHNAAPSKGTAPPAQRSRRDMVASKGFGGASSGGSSLGAPRLEAQGGLSGGIGGGFQGTYKAPAKGSTSAMRQGTKVAASRRAGTLKGGGDGLASAQLAATKRMVSGHARQADVSSPGYGPTYDGSQPAGGGTPAGAIGGTGVGGGAEGVGAGPGNPATINNIQKEAPPPPAVKGKKDKTPYKNLIYAAIGLLLGGMAVLWLAGQAADAAKAAPDPATKAAKWGLANFLSFVATAMGLAVVAIGVILATQWDQKLQGAMFAIGGAILTYQAGKALIEGMSAAEEAEGTIKTDVTGRMGQEAVDNLGGIRSVNPSGNGSATVNFGNGATRTVTYPQPAPTGPAAPQPSGLDFTLGDVQTPGH